ncbi:MAG: T9SS type A sorting domain-containing protein [Leptolyngbya sp. SIO3F4]|nr:T9SS type A sorting domain-containing protein [Leptolyngbya sp. SIO3F4]
MNHGGPMYDFYTGCALSSSTPLTAPVQEAGFVLRVDDHPQPIWTDISSLVTNPMDPPPTVTAISSFEEDIFVGGYKNEDVTLTPTSNGNIIPNNGNSTMNAYYTYIYSDAGLLIGDFLKTTPTTVEQAEEVEVTFAVYPNPANEVFYVRIDDDVQLQQVILKDIAGRDIRAWNGQEAAGGLSVGDIPSGIYFLEIESDGIRATERVVIR